MCTTYFSLILSTWGAVVATVLAVIRLIDYRKNNSRSLLLEAIIPRELDVLQIAITNESRRPISIRDVSVRYGKTPASSQTVTQIEGKDLQNKKLNEAEFGIRYNIGV